MHKTLSQFLEIEKYKIIRVFNYKNELIIRIKPLNRRQKCPNCKKCKISRHANGIWRRKKHSHFQEKLIYLEIKRDRLKCMKCKHVFSQELPMIPKYSRKTINFVKQSLSYLSKNSFNEVSTVNKVSYSVLKKQLYDNVNPHELLEEKIKLLEKQDEIFLGLDGQSFRGTEMILTVTDVINRKVITILPSETKKDLIKFLRILPESIRLKVKGIAMDMTNKHKYTLHKYFANSVIVTDKYHVIQIAIKHMQNVRKVIQSARKIQIPLKKEMDTNIEDLVPKQKIKLFKYFIKYPDLRKAYIFKERVRAIYKTSKKEKAQHKYKILKKDLLNSTDLDMKQLGKTLSNWENEILNYFTHRITNAYTEGIHTKCKLLKRKSYGFRNVETYVRKLILGLMPFFIFSIHTF